MKLVNTFAAERANLNKAIFEAYMAEDKAKSPRYHNLHHMLGHLKLAIEIYLTDEPTPHLFDLTALTIACMFHDYGHSGGKLSDKENIAIAVERAIKFIDYTAEAYPSVLNGVDVIQLKEEVTDLIETTEYPYTVAPTTTLDMIMRDADLIWAASTGNPKVIMEDLRLEIMEGKGIEISYEQMLEGQKKFMDEAVIYTPTGKRLWEQYAGPYIETMIQYVQSVRSEE